MEWKVTEPDRTIDLCLRLAEVNADILNEVFRFCRLNDISISKGLAELIREARMTAQRIEDLSDLSLPLASPESKQGDDFGLTNGEVTEPTNIHLRERDTSLSPTHSISFRSHEFEVR